LTGQPYGTALKTRALSAGSASADSFVAWLAGLFCLAPRA
jgi:hypothetical protein